MEELVSNLGVDTRVGDLESGQLRFDIVSGGIRDIMQIVSTH